jgi:TorA maturation chaperone TorD
MAKVSGAKRMYDEDVWLYEINNYKHVWICRICDYRNPDEDECLRHFIEKHPQEWLHAYLLRIQQTEVALRMAADIIGERLAALDDAV